MDTHASVRCLAFMLFFLASGCGKPQAEPVPRADASAFAEDDAEASESFEAADTATVRGRVTWSGAIPTVAPFTIRFLPEGSPVFREQRERPNPNAPVIAPDSRGVAQAVVFLRGVDPKKARPWNLPPVRVEQRDRQLHVVQGSVDASSGFVRRGAAVEMTSREPIFHSLHARGAACFALPFPDPDQPLSRRLNEKGVIELSSGAGFYWMRAYLFVDDHPYYARTDAQGRFVLPQVPASDYELVCWLPSWHVQRHDRDPESGLISRLEFGPPLESVRKITVNAGAETTCDVQVSEPAK